MDDIEISPKDIALLDEDTTSVIPETPNTIGQSLVKRLGLAEAEAASNFLNTFCTDNTGVASPHSRVTQSIDEILPKPLGLILKEKGREEAKAQYLSQCLEDDIIPTSLV